MVRQEGLKRSRGKLVLVIDCLSRNCVHTSATVRSRKKSRFPELEDTKPYIKSEVLK